MCQISLAEIDRMERDDQEVEVLFSLLVFFIYDLIIGSLLLARTDNLSISFGLFAFLWRPKMGDCDRRISSQRRHVIDAF